MGLELLNKCPVCLGQNINNKKINCKDYTTSQEVFDIAGCNNCNFMFTNPRPNTESIGGYYQSEDYISHTNTNKGLINKLYQSARNITLKRKLALINSLINNNSERSILDIGCGTGNFLHKCKDNGWQVKGVEPDNRAREIAENNLNEKLSNDFLTQDYTQKFDIISLWHVLEHIHELDQTINKIKQLLNKNGSIIIAVPNHLSADAAIYQNFWAAYDVPRHLYHFDKKTMYTLMQRHGLKVVKTVGMNLDSFYVSMLSEKYKNGRVNYIKAFTNGLISNIKAWNSGEYSSLIYIIKGK